MLRQRRQHASDSLPTPSNQPQPATSKLSSSRRNMETEPASELRSLIGRGDTDSDADSMADSSAGATGGGGGGGGTSRGAAPVSPPEEGNSDANTNTNTNTNSTWLQRNHWVALALASGACAAFNGVFAKLTTTELTTRLSQAVARIVGLDAVEAGVEVVVRGTFFALNLVFNGVMWTLFTRALARGHSATQVSIMNTSANFVLTALLGFAIFSEALPPLWWAGAALLVAGNVIIGRKDEGKDSTAPEAGADAADAADATDSTRFTDYDPDAVVVDAGDDPLAADEAAVAATTVSAAAATFAGGASSSRTTESGTEAAAASFTSTSSAAKGQRSSRRLAALREPGTASASASASTSNASSILVPAEEKGDKEDDEDEDFAHI